MQLVCDLVVSSGMPVMRRVVGLHVWKDVEGGVEEKEGRIVKKEACDEPGGGATARWR
jgi:hypothetical protein